MSDAGLVARSYVATSLFNLDSSRSVQPSLEKRKPGWTEVWGGKDDSGRKKKTSARHENAPPPSPTASGGPILGGKVARWISGSPSHWDHEDRSSSYLLERSSAPPVVAVGGRGGERRAVAPLSLVLTQHRVAWREQLVLRAAGLPHCVRNSAYMASEAVGPLPYLRDLGGEEGPAEAAGEGERGGAGREPDRDRDLDARRRLRRPALVGRRNPGGMAASGEEAFEGNGGGSSPRPPTTRGSDAVEYLRVALCVDLDSDLSDRLRSDGAALSSLVIDRLDPILAAMRYGDREAWDQVYRPQSVRACLSPNGNVGGVGPHNRRPNEERGVTQTSWFRPFARIQAWSERSAALKNLAMSGSASSDLFGGGAVGTGATDVNVPAAVRAARSCYGALDARLSLPEDGGGGGVGGDEEVDATAAPRSYLLGTARPTNVDASLFEHLAEALCDVHLVTVLADYGNLLRFFQSTYEAYFGRGYGGTGADSEYGGGMVDWVGWNDNINSVNAFNCIPIGGGSGIRATEPRDVINIMQSMALHCRDLGEVVADAKVQRRQEAEAVAGVGGGHPRNAAGEMFRRWLMGADLSAEGMNDEVGTSRRAEGGGRGGKEEKEEDEMTRKAREQMEKMQRENRANDELWISGVLLASAMAYMVAAAKSAAEGQ